MKNRHTFALTSSPFIEAKYVLIYDDAGQIATGNALFFLLEILQMMCWFHRLCWNELGSIGASVDVGNDPGNAGRMELRSAPLAAKEPPSLVARFSESHHQ